MGAGTGAPAPALQPRDVRRPSRLSRSAVRQAPRSGPRGGPFRRSPFDICTVPERHDFSKHLSHLDDNWVRAGMRLGLIRDALIFGVHDEGGLEFPLAFRNAAGESHQIDLLARPLSELAYQGELGDSIRVNEFAWDVLGWGRVNDRRWFLKIRSPSSSTSISITLRSNGKTMYFLGPRRYSSGGFLSDQSNTPPLDGPVRSSFWGSSAGPGS